MESEGKKEGEMASLPTEEKKDKRAIFNRGGNINNNNNNHQHQANGKANGGRRMEFEDVRKMVVELMESSNYSWLFVDPMEAERFNLNDYHTIVTQPTNLTTVLNKLNASISIQNAQSNVNGIPSSSSSSNLVSLGGSQVGIEGKFKDVEEALEELNRVWRNVYVYFNKSSRIYQEAMALEREFLEKKKRIQNGKDNEWNDDTFNDFDSSDICGICNEGGELLICDGKCMQAFHLRCLGLTSAPTTARWFCSKCRRKEKNSNYSMNNSQGRSSRIGQILNPNAKAKLDPSQSNFPISAPTTNPFASTFLTKPNPSPLSRPTLPGSVKPQPLAPIKLNLLKPTEPNVHLKRGIPTIEERVVRRKIEEGVKNNFMSYDPNWSCWRPKINRKEFSDALGKLITTESAKQKVLKT